MHRGDSFGSRLEDFTSVFHICNDQPPRETKNRDNEPEKEGERGKQSEKKAQTWRWSDREGTTEKRAEKEGRERKKTKAGKSRTERQKVNTSGESPGVWAPPRRVGPTPTIPASTYRLSSRTTRHLHIAGFYDGETACRSNKRGPGHARAKPANHSG